MSFAWDPNFQMGPESAKLASRVWPSYLSEPSDLPQPDLALELDADFFLQRYPSWGLRDGHGKLVAYTNGVFLRMDPSSVSLPEEGWMYAIGAGNSDEIPNGLCLLVANVDPTLHGQGLSKLLIDKAKSEARARGLRYMWAPVRPSQFHTMPSTSFDDYVHMRRPDGQLVDLWLRAHERAGGEMLNVCHRSAVVTASLEKWFEWTGGRYTKSGSYPLAGGLAPLQIDIEKNIGTYEEPNVWFRYTL